MLNISKQSYVYTVFLIITTLINLFVSAFVFGISGFIIYLYIFIFGIPFMILSIYNIDCLTTGGCEIWSWIVSILSSISLLVTTVFFIIIGILKEKKTV